MGAWGIEVLQNDAALDAMMQVNGKTQEGAAEWFLEDLDPAIKLLGVAIVDASLNGADETILGCFYEYEDFFKGLKPMEGLREEAIKNLKVVEEDLDSWFAEYREDRRTLLQRLEQRLR